MGLSPGLPILWARPLTAVGRSPVAPSLVGSVPKACGLFLRPSRSHGFVVCPLPLLLAEEALRGWMGRPQPPPPVERGGRVGLWEFR